MVKFNFWERLFPIKRDFYKMLAVQAESSAKVVRFLCIWLNSRTEEDYRKLLSEADAADQHRFNMENNLIEAFATPFDRQDIYSLSIEMDKIVEYAKSTLMEMEAFQVAEDSVIHNMAQQLQAGTDQLAEAIRLLKDDPHKSQKQIEIIRKAQKAIADEYRAGMAAVFKSKDPMQALKCREVYHHIKDAEVYLGYTTDILHKIIVRLV
ncbi:MAG: hypothetical protein AWM53_00741 [Candidatus Dichloromethanomonas elyunquensis]|nr:MAG: hypothetical protein AWM53_00741 [Candidatus Dichloromethanomonas elyunquensis]